MGHFHSRPAFASMEGTYLPFTPLPSMDAPTVHSAGLFVQFVHSNSCSSKNGVFSHCFHRGKTDTFCHFAKNHKFRKVHGWLPFVHLDEEIKADQKMAKNYHVACIFTGSCHPKMRNRLTRYNRQGDKVLNKVDKVTMNRVTILNKKCSKLLYGQQNYCMNSRTV